jgi:lipopolysaccharide export system permease protein
MKAAGIPYQGNDSFLGVATVLAIMLFFFSNNIIPDFQKKRKICFSILPRQSLQ